MAPTAYLLLALVLQLVARHAPRPEPLPVPVTPARQSIPPNAVIAKAAGGQQ